MSENHSQDMPLEAWEQILDREEWDRVDKEIHNHRYPFQYKVFNSHSQGKKRKRRRFPEAVVLISFNNGRTWRDAHGKRTISFEKSLQESLIKFPQYEGENEWNVFENLIDEIIRKANLV